MGRHDTIREVIVYPPPARPSDESRARTHAADVVAWLRELEVDEKPTSVAFTGAVSVFAILVATEGLFLRAVPDEAISAAAREALDQKWARTFALEDVEHAGQLWMLSYTGTADPGALDWLAGARGIELSPLLEQRVLAASRSFYYLGSLAGATVTHCYGAQLVH